MTIYDTMVDGGDCYVFTNSEVEVLMPASSVILVDDESGFISIKTTASRKTIGLLKK